MTANRFRKMVFAPVLGLAVWCSGPTLQEIPAASAQTPIIGIPGIYQVSYFDVSSSFAQSQQWYGGPGHSGGNGDGVLRIVDVGNYEIDPRGDLCPNIYVFDDDQEMQECCSCPITADGLWTISVIKDLTSNPQFSSPLGTGVIKIVGIGIIGDPFSCSSGWHGEPGTAGAVSFGGPPGPGLRAWISHTESIASNNPNFTPPFGFITSSVTHFAAATIDEDEGIGPNGLATLCLNIELHASGRGICTCGVGDAPPLPLTSDPATPSQESHGWDWRRWPGWRPDAGSEPLRSDDVITREDLEIPHPMVSRTLVGFPLRSQRSPTSGEGGFPAALREAAASLFGGNHGTGGVQRGVHD